jgi:hypothetical protein
MSSHALSSRSPVNQQYPGTSRSNFPNNTRDSRSPTLRETPIGPRSPQVNNNPTPDLIRCLVEGYRAQLIEQREKEDRFVQELRSHRIKLDGLLGHILDAVDRMVLNYPVPDALRSEATRFFGRDESHAVDQDREESESHDVEELLQTVEMDSILGTQDSSSMRWIPGREIGPKKTPRPRTPSEEEPEQSDDILEIERSSSPTIQGGDTRGSNIQSSVARHPGEQRPGNTSSSGSLLTPVRTPNRKRKRTEVEASPSRISMGPPPARRAAEFSAAKTKEMWKFSEQSSREQSEALSDGTAPIISCHCGQLDCAICKPREKIRRHIHNFRR